MKKFNLRICIVLLIFFLLSACNPIVSYHGFNNIEGMRLWAKKNTILKKELIARFGPASFIDRDSLGEGIESYYYVSFKKERFAFFKPEVTKRHIMALHFLNNQFIDYAEYSLDDGHNIKLISDKTPTYGKELSVIQQILSNVGKFNNVPGQRSGTDGAIMGPIPGGI